MAYAQNYQNTWKSLDSRPIPGWFEDAKFGLFIHWGLYAIPAGYWHGKAIPGPSEWIMYEGKIPVKDYEPLAKEFNPTQFSAEKWAVMAKEAGMKYIVLRPNIVMGLLCTILKQWLIILCLQLLLNVMF